MMKRVGIAELKAKLSEYVRAARSGEEWVVMDRRTPAARLVPYSSEGPRVRIRPRKGTHDRLASIPLPSPVKTRRDSLSYLTEEREGER